MKILAVSQRVDRCPERDEIRDSLDQRLVIFLSVCNHMVVPVPNNLGDSISEWVQSVRPSGLVLSGGNDIGQWPDRDETELFLLSYAQQRHLPVLGICRGMQMMAYRSATGLHPVKGHVGTRHRLVGTISGEVNSFHDFSLIACPEDFTVLARSEDGGIEAMRHESLPWEGWMWHPEREKDFSALHQRRIKVLFGD